MELKWLNNSNAVLNYIGPKWCGLDNDLRNNVAMQLTSRNPIKKIFFEDSNDETAASTSTFT